MFRPNRYLTNNLAKSASSIPSSNASEDKQTIWGPQTACKTSADVMLKKIVDAPTADKDINAKEDSAFNEGCATSATSKTSSPTENKQRNSEECVERWELEALNHFRNSSWEDVIFACDKVLQVPGQKETNFTILFNIGYAYMRIEEYETAATYLMGAHRIDSSRVTIRLVMRELRRKIALGPSRKRGRGGISRPGTAA